MVLGHASDMPRRSAKPSESTRRAQTQTRPRQTDEHMQRDREFKPGLFSAEASILFFPTGRRSTRYITKVSGTAAITTK